MREIERFEEVSRLIPWGTQTNAKRPRPSTYATSPFFVDHAQGAVLVNTEGKEFVDYFCACGPIILGHAVKAVDEAVKAQIDKGFVFSLASPLEYELAKKLIGLFPCYDWVRFLKTGNDATTAAVRLARAYTGKNKILQYGYHGWNDWAQTRHGFAGQAGIPSGVLAYTIPFCYNDLAFIQTTLENDPDIAGVILTPHDFENEPKDGFLTRLRALCTQYGVPLIFDEVLSGFRAGLHGIQGEFGVQPDLCCFAKAVANGYPLSVVMGRKEYAAALAENRTIITTTYAGETLSIAAALATLETMERTNAFDTIARVGARLQTGLQEIIARGGYPLRLTGRPALQRLFVEEKDPQKELQLTHALSNYYFCQGQFVREMHGLGFYLTAAHTPEQIDRLLEVSQQAFAQVF